MLFDGEFGFLIIDMSMIDCLMDFIFCIKGLLIGMNVKFDNFVKDYKEIRYLLDMGV